MELEILKKLLSDAYGEQRRIEKQISHLTIEQVLEDGGAKFQGLINRRIQLNSTIRKLKSGIGQVAKERIGV